MTQLGEQVTAKVNLTIEEVVYWCAIAYIYSDQAPTPDRVAQAINLGDVGRLWWLERAQLVRARMNRADAYHMDLYRENIFLAMLLRQARRLALKARQ